MGKAQTEKQKRPYTRQKVRQEPEKIDLSPVSDSIPSEADSSSNTKGGGRPRKSEKEDEIKNKAGILALLDIQLYLDTSHSTEDSHNSKKDTRNLPPALEDIFQTDILLTNFYSDKQTFDLYNKMIEWYTQVQRDLIDPASEQFVPLSESWFLDRIQKERGEPISLLILYTVFLFGMSTKASHTRFTELCKTLKKRFERNDPNLLEPDHQDVDENKREFYKLLHKRMLNAITETSIDLQAQSKTPLEEEHHQYFQCFDQENLPYYSELEKQKIN